MSYTIENTGSSIRFISDDGFFLLMKNHIRAISHVREDMIKIDTGCCFHSIFIYHHQIVAPYTGNVMFLVTLLNKWITDFLQANPTLPGSGGE